MSVMVSINCITYNHGKYIGDAIESFLRQKTKFDFEILIGEDCSTDDTRRIVESYISRYPKKIRLVTSECNVGAKKNCQRLYDNSKGKYIAVCEGDDYWVDPYKLQKQVDYMEKNPQCTMCFHAAKIVTPQGKSIGKSIKPCNTNREFSAGDIVIGGGGIFPTASLLFPRVLTENFPDWYMEASVGGDYPLALILTSHGYAYYIDEIMSAYRTGVPESWTSRNMQLERIKQNMIHASKQNIFVIDKFNHYSNFRYANEADNAIKKNEVRILLIERKWSELKSDRCREYLQGLNFRRKAKLYSLTLFPVTYKKVSNFRNLILSYLMNCKSRIRCL